MKSSVARITTLLVMLLMPVFAVAQSTQTQGGMIYGQNTPFGGSFNFTGFQQFSGGSFMMPGMLGMGLPGLGGGTTGYGVASVAVNIIFIINSVLVPLLFAISFIVFLYGIAKTYIFSSGDEAAVKSGHQIILWGLIGFAVMVSVWGLVNVVVVTFGLATPFGSTFPSSFGTQSR